MDDSIQQLEELTENILNGLEQTTYEELSTFVERRESILQELQSRMDEGSVILPYKERVQRVLAADASIVARMKELLEEAAAYRTRMEAGRMQRRAYDNNNDGESYFFDKKK